MFPIPELVQYEKWFHMLNSNYSIYNANSFKEVSELCNVLDYFMLDQLLQILLDKCTRLEVSYTNGWEDIELVANFKQRFKFTSYMDITDMPAENHEYFISCINWTKYYFDYRTQHIINMLTPNDYQLILKNKSLPSWFVSILHKQGRETLIRYTYNKACATDEIRQSERANEMRRVHTMTMHNRLYEQYLTRKNQRFT